MPPASEIHNMLRIKQIKAIGSLKNTLKKAPAGIAKPPCGLLKSPLLKI